MTTRVQNIKTPSREFRLDPLTCSRLTWIQSLFSSHGWRPSGSIIVRRALSHYTDHLGDTFADESQFKDEFIVIKSHRNTEESPFHGETLFDGRSLSAVLKEVRDIKLNRRFDRVFGKDFREGSHSPTAWEGIWDRVERGEKV